MSARAGTPIQTAAAVPGSLQDPAAAVPTRAKTIADTYRHAARLIEEHGWARSDWRTDDGALCLAAAIAEAATGWWGMALGMVDALPPVTGDDNDRLFVRAYHRLEIHLGRSPEDWNDKVATDAGEVTELLRAMAHQAMERAA